MIGYLKGILSVKSPPHVIIECSGVGYELDVPMSTFYILPDIGQQVILYTHLSIREDAHLLFGFSSQDERLFFRQLLKVSGVGARVALSILSSMTKVEFVRAVLQKDPKPFKTIPGVGPRLADRLLVEMKDIAQLSEQMNAVSDNVMDNQSDDVMQALIALGYSTKEVKDVLRKIDISGDISQSIKTALRHLSKATNS